MNTYALQLSGLWTEAEEKAARWKDGRARVGSSVARDANGVPTGVGTEVKDRFIDNMFTREERKAAVRSQIVPHFVSKGLTTLASLPMHLNALSIDQELQLAGELPMRLRSYYRLPDLTTIDAIIDLGLLPGVGNDMMRYGGPKVYVAGNSHDAYGNVGPNMKWTQEELNDVIWRGHSAGQQFLLHQAGGSLPATFEAIGKAQAKDRRDLRHRLEHYSGLRDPAEIRQMKELGMRVSITTPQSGRRNPGGAAPQLPLYNTLIRAGLEPVGISDATGTVPDFGPLNSIASITSPLSEGGSAPAGEAPSIEDAIRMWTIWSATSTFEEGEKGSITPGKLGDFAVLSHDLEKVRGGQMFDVTNTATILGGKLVYNG